MGFNSGFKGLNGSELSVSRPDHFYLWEEAPLYGPQGRSGRFAAERHLSALFEPRIVQLVF